VETISVLSPWAAHARAVQAATEVLPTPPLPVYRIVRGAMAGRVYGRAAAAPRRAGVLPPAARHPAIVRVPVIALKFPARSVAASRTLYVPACSAGIVNVLTP